MFRGTGEIAFNLKIKFSLKLTMDLYSKTKECNAYCTKLKTMICNAIQLKESPQNDFKKNNNEVDSNEAPLLAL